METEFRRYQEKDYIDLLEMIFSLYREDPEGKPIDEEKIKRTIDEFWKNPDKVKIYMFQTGDKNIGYAILVYFWSNEYGGDIITIDELYVNDACRGRGIATEFFSFVERMENKAALQLETTPSNQKAFNYYKRLGFVPSENMHLIRQD